MTHKKFTFLQQKGVNVKVRATQYSYSHVVGPVAFTAATELLSAY